MSRDDSDFHALRSRLDKGDHDRRAIQRELDMERSLDRVLYGIAAVLVALVCGIGYLLAPWVSTWFR